MSAHGDPNLTYLVPSVVPSTLPSANTVPSPTIPSAILVDPSSSLSDSLVRTSANSLSTAGYALTISPSSPPLLVNPPPDPPDPVLTAPPSLTPVPPAPPPCERAWTSLFKHIPKNAGKYIPVHLSPFYEDDALVPPADVIDAGTTIWKDTLVGFFLDKPLSYTAVISKLKLIWKLKGSVKVKSDGILFLFNFSCAEDRDNILQCDPIILNKKLFILKPYDPSISNVAGSVTAVPVWVNMYNLPIFAWSPLGINWLCSHLGKMLCMDQMTEKQERLSYAKCLVEVKPSKELPEEFMVKLVEGGQQKIHVQYMWKPDICVLCNAFGHKSDVCNNKKEELFENKVEDNSKTIKEKEVIKAKPKQLKRNERQAVKRNFKVWQRVTRKRMDPVNKSNKEEKREDIIEMQREVSEVNKSCELTHSGKIEVEKQVTREIDESNEKHEEDTVNIVVGIEGAVECSESETEGNPLTYNKFAVLLTLDDEENVSDKQEEEMNVRDKCQFVQSKVDAKQQENNIQRQKEEEGSSKTKKEKHKMVHTKFDTCRREVEVEENKGVGEASNCESLESGLRKKNNIKLPKHSTKSQEDKEGHIPCTAKHTNHSSNTFNPDFNSSPNTPLPHLYSNIKPPHAFKAPPSAAITTLPTKPTTPTHSFSKMQEDSSKQAVTPLSATIPNYLSSKQAVTRSMKIEFLNAQIDQ